MSEKIAKFATETTRNKMLFTLILIAPLYGMVGYLWSGQRDLEKQKDERIDSLQKQVDYLETAVRRTIDAVEIIGGLDKRNGKEKEDEDTKEN